MTTPDALDPDDAHSVARVYDTVAASYAELLPDGRAEAPEDLDLVHDLARLTVRGRTHPTLLDAGCGTGRMIGVLRRDAPSLDVTGADVSPGMLAEARRAQPDASFVEAPLDALPFPDAAFDGVLAWYSIIHTTSEDLPGTLAELARVLRPGGSMLLGFHAGHGTRQTSRAYGHDVQLVTSLHDADAVAQLLRGGGLDVESVVTRAARERERGPQGFVLARRPR